MFLHIGSDVVARSEDIIGVFDMDNTTISVRDREFLSNAQRCGEVVNICDDLPKSLKYIDRKSVLTYTFKYVDRKKKYFLQRNDNLIES